MSDATTTPNQIIRNVAALDLRTTAAATLATIKSIENVAAVIFSAETAPHLAGINLSNVASTLEASPTAKVLTGQTILASSSLAKTPLSAIIMGQLFVDRDVTVEVVERGLENLVVTGQVLCPEHLAGVLQSKISHLSGQFVTYPTAGKLVLGKATFTEMYLRQLPDKTSLVVLGKLLATQPLPAELIEQKVAQLHVDGKVVLAEENSALLGKILGQSTFGDATIIPAGFDYVERLLALDAETLETFSARKLFCTNVVQFAEGVTPEVLAGAIDKLVASHLLIAPSPLRKTLAQQCDLLNTRAIFYPGKLAFIDGELTLDHAWFEAREGQVTLVVTGELALDPALDPNVLSARLHRVHNLGEISGNAAQLAALQARTDRNEGEWQEMGRTPTTDGDATVMGDIAYLRL